jgi:hypothetical protein
MFLQPFTALHPGGHRRCFYVDGGRSSTLNSGTSWIPDGDQWSLLPEIPAAPRRGPAIDVSNFGGGRYRTYRQHPPGGPPSTSSTSMVAAARHAGSTPQGACHRHFELRWWPLPNMPGAPHRGSAIDVSNFGGGRCRPCRQHPPGGLPSTSSTSVVAAVGHTASNPRGPPSTS